MNRNNEIALEVAIETLLKAIGEDPKREGLRDTPARVARFWKEFIDYDPGDLDTTFEAISASQMIVIRDITAHSMCEHHLLPFRVSVTVGYICSDRILGISKIVRVVQKHAHKLQLQERLAYDIALEIEELTHPRGVGVHVEGDHLCMQMRGVRNSGQMVSSVLRGEMLDCPEVRAEFQRIALRG